MEAPGLILLKAPEATFSPLKKNAAESGMR
jgi:hypothetical protein